MKQSEFHCKLCVYECVSVIINDSSGVCSIDFSVLFGERARQQNQTKNAIKWNYKQIICWCNGYLRYFKLCSRGTCNFQEENIVNVCLKPEYSTKNRMEKSNEFIKCIEKVKTTSHLYR